MFKAKTERIEALSKNNPKIIEELEKIFDKKTNVYIDFSNIVFWQDRLNWHICLKRLKQFLDSFSNIRKVKSYYGTLEGDLYSEQLVKEVKRYRYDFKTKPVKIIPISIDVSSIAMNSPSLLENFIRKPFLSKLSIEDIEFLNKKLKDLNDQGIRYLEDRKCNFDVEIGVAMELDSIQNDAESFVLWSGDSDFEGPVNQLLEWERKVIIFMTARRISTELAGTKTEKFEIKKIKEFICRAKELPENLRENVL